MQMYITALTALMLACITVAKPSMVVKESVSAPSDWVRRAPAPDTHMLNLQFGLKQRAADDLETKLLDVSDPKSANYGKWLTQEETKAYLQPTNDTVTAVRRWLAKNGIQENLSKRGAVGDWMSAHMSVAQARDLLGNADFAVWEHRQTGEQLVRAIEYSVPRDVADHVDLIGPTTYFNKIRTVDKLGKRSSSLKWEGLSESFDEAFRGMAISQNAPKMQKVSAGSPPAASCNASAVSYTCLRQFYKTINYKVASPTKQLIAISGFLEEYASFSDLKKFFQTQRPEAYAADYKFNVVLNGPSSVNDQKMPGSEANLDVQAVGAVAYNIPFTYISNPGRPPFKADKGTPTNTNEPYTTELEYLLNLSDAELPSILTTSYGDNEQTVPLAYQKRVCREIATLGARGTSVFFSSGDSGVGPTGACVSNDGKNTSMFLPAFPASCPYATTVGATEGFNPEIASGPTAGYAGGGGFSNTWPMPDYQKAVVQPYVQSLGNLHKDLYNPNGRAYPDLSAQGSRFITVVNGTYGLVSGTSASCPLTAAIFSLLNDKRLSSGKPKLGFINPALYSGLGDKGLNDITVGSNKGCGTDGFPAKQGWDAATGFGTPDFDKLSSVFA